MKKVLIAVDYHPSSEMVVQAGFMIGKKLGAQICLMHVVADIGYYGIKFDTFMGYSGYDSATNFKVHKELLGISNDYLEAIADHLNDPSIITRTEEGKTAETIVACAKDWNADMIVLGTHSHSKLEKILMGTVASKVVEKTDVPIFLVPLKE